MVVVSLLMNIGLVEVECFVSGWTGTRFAFVMCRPQIAWPLSAVARLLRLRHDEET